MSHSSVSSASLSPSDDPSVSSASSVPSTVPPPGVLMTEEDDSSSPALPDLPPPVRWAPELPLWDESSPHRLTFRWSGIHVSYANALQRTLLSDVPMIGFRTSPFEKNESVIAINTSRTHDQLMQQRLSCLPVHALPTEEDPDAMEVVAGGGSIPSWARHLPEVPAYLQNARIRLRQHNRSDTELVVTTEHIEVVDGVGPTARAWKTEQVRRLFPPFVPPESSSEYFIPFVRLAPQWSSDQPGEQLDLECPFALVTAREKATYNAVGTAGFAGTLDLPRQTTELATCVTQWKDKGYTPDEIAFQTANWRCLDGRRIVVPGSFDFVVASVGVETHGSVVVRACRQLVRQGVRLRDQVHRREWVVQPTPDTLARGFDVLIPIKGTTWCRLLSHELFVEGVSTPSSRVFSFVAGDAMHPHDSTSKLRLVLAESSTVAVAPIDVVWLWLAQSMDQLVERWIQIESMVRARASWSADTPSGNGGKHGAMRTGGGGASLV
jgi:hypothetical protein